ncbi:hypothetical protein K488DRAFT_10005, partial [Vararia minispora EC-137]
YISCTAIDRNIFIGDDPSTLAFLPLADDPTFAPHDFLELHDFLGWITSSPDSLDEFAALETAARLQESFGMSLGDIDNILDDGNSPVLSWPLLGKHRIFKGLIPVFIHRNLPQWPKPGPERLFTRPENSRVPRPLDSYTRISTFNRVFCPSFACVQFFCHVHRAMMRLPRTMTLVSSEWFRSSGRTPCEYHCFLTGGSPSTVNLWTPEELQELRGILRVDPSIFPCDLAVVLARPCNEVFAVRDSCLPEPHPLPPPIAERRPLRKAHKLKFREYSHILAGLDDDIHSQTDRKPKDFTPIPPCTHLGSCDASMDCPCFKESVHCERSCHCSPQCSRRWAGCSCSQESKTKGLCISKSCVCIQTGRECDPELCENCRAPSYSSKEATDSVENGCLNCLIQLSTPKMAIVRPSSFGYGLFIQEPANKGDFIIEYVGELIYKPTANSREFINAHRRRNYVYGLNKEMNIDAMFAGNNSRFINHAPKEQRNCDARTRLIHGEHRIGIYASRDIAAGEELFLCYGNEYFFYDESGKPIPL